MIKQRGLRFSRRHVAGADGRAAALARALPSFDCRRCSLRLGFKALRHAATQGAQRIKI